MNYKLPTDCPGYRAAPQHDIEHLEELPLFERLMFKNKLGLKRTERDLKEIKEYEDSIKATENFGLKPSDILVEKSL